MTNGTFLLGLGAQKCGTTWLHEYLSSAAGSDFGFAKEYHILDAKFVPGSAGHRPNVAGRLRNLTLHPADIFHTLRHIKRDVRRRKLYRDLSGYIDYFAALLSRPNIVLTGDFTPSNGAVGAKVLREVRDGFLARGVRFRAILIVRDPVERCWSAVRMRHRNARRRLPFRTDTGSEEAELKATYRMPKVQQRTRYERTIEQAQQAFGPDEFRVVMFEELFEQATLDRLMDWIGVDRAPGALDRSLNPSPRREALSEATRREIAAFYADTYRAVDKLMPGGQVLSRWENAHFVLEDGRAGALPGAP